MTVFRTLLILLFLFNGIAHAQTTQTGPAVSSSETIITSSATDTVAAVKKLFAQRRRGGWFYTSRITGFSILPAIALLALDSNPIGIGLIGASIGVGVGKLIRFSSKKENAIISAYQQGKPLPQPIRRRLKSKFF